MDPIQYCPVIKGKANDIKAMAYLAPTVAAVVKPVYELPPFSPDDRPEDVLGRFASRLSKLVGSRPCYVDFPLLKPGAQTTNREIALEVAYGQLRALRVPFEPVYGFDRDESLWPIVIREAARSRGMLLRLDPDDLDFADETVERIGELIAGGVDPGGLDVMADCRYLPNTTTALSLAATVADFADKLGSVVKVRRFVLAGSCAPKTVADIQRDGYGSVRREELVMWASVATERLQFPVIYADYGVIHPDFSDLTLATHINGKIRYTQGKHIHIHRGHSLRQGDKFQQYRRLSAAVVASGRYQGHTYSHGDRYIYDCSTGHAGTGNAGTWVLVDQNHHVSYVAQQIQRLSAAAAAGRSADAVLSLA
jgi:hypothetical protein